MDLFVFTNKTHTFENDPTRKTLSVSTPDNVPRLSYGPLLPRSRRHPQHRRLRLLTKPNWLMYHLLSSRLPILIVIVLGQKSTNTSPHERPSFVVDFVLCIPVRPLHVWGSGPEVLV